MLNETDTLPQGLLDVKAEQLLDLLGSPTLIHLEGENRQPLFISTLLHGNETTGFYAVQQLLQSYANRPLPRSISVFIGNVAAAAVKRRRLDSQPDYNRIWPGSHHADCAETDMMNTVSNIMRTRKPFASIDIHNNTGRNPHYACVNILNAHCLQLAGMFGGTVVYFTSPKGVQSAAFSDFCPSVVLECGQSGEADGITHSRDFIRTVLELDKIPGDQPSHIRLYHTVARVTVPEMYSLDAGGDADLHLSHELENRNFNELSTGSVFAGIGANPGAHLIVTNESNEDVNDEFLEIVDRRIVLKKSVTLSMYTTDERAIRNDCLCYLMERLQIS